MAVVYQKDKNAIKFVIDFYKKFKPDHRLTQVEIDSIFAQYDGDYETMVKDIYGALTEYTPSDSDITSVVNRYALKKKDSANGLLESETGESEQLEISENNKGFTAEDGAFVTDLNLSTDEELYKGLEGAKPGTSATLNFKGKKPRSLEGRQNYPIHVYADGGYQGVLKPGGKMTTSPASKVVEIPTNKPFKAQNGAIVPDEPIINEDQDTWDYDYILKTFTKNGSPVDPSEVPVNIMADLKIDIQNQHDLQKREKSRNDAEIQAELKKVEFNQNFEQFYGVEGDSNFYKAVDLYGQNPENFQFLLENVEDGGMINYEGLEIPLTTSISENGKDLLSGLNANNNTYMYEVPLGGGQNEEILSEYGVDSGLSIEDEEQLYQSLDADGLAQYETILNMDNHMASLLGERSELIGGKHLYKEQKKNKFKRPEAVYEEGVEQKTILGNVNYNNLNEDQKTKYEELTNKIENIKLAKKKLTSQILSSSNKHGVNDVKTAYGGLKTHEQRVAFYNSSNDQINASIDRSESYQMNLVIGEIKSEIQQDLSDQFSVDTEYKKVLNNYQSNRGVKFKSTEEMLNDKVFMNMVSDMENSRLSNINMTIADIDWQNAETYKTQLKLNNALKDKTKKLQNLELQRQNEKIDEEEYIEQSTKLNQEITILRNKTEENRQKRGYEKGTEMFDQSGERIEGPTATQEDKIIQQQITNKESQFIQALNQADDYGSFVDQLMRAQDGLYSTELMNQDIWKNEKMTLPSGKKMTLEEMYSFIQVQSGDVLGPGGETLYSANLDFGARALREKFDSESERNTGVIGVRQQLRTIDKSIPLFVAKNFGEGPKEDAEFMIEVLKNFKARYYENQTQLVAISNVLTFNVDPGKEWSEKTGTGLFLRQAVESFGHAVHKRHVHTEDDMINYYDDIANAYGIELTDEQKAAGEISLNDMVAQGVGTTLPIMIEMIATMPIAGAGLKTLTKVPMIKNVMVAAKTTDVGKFWWNFSENVVRGAVAFEMTSGDQATWRMGAAEGATEQIVNSLFKRTPVTRGLLTLYRNFGKPGVKITTLPPRILAGGGAELLAEYSGEFVENLTNMGFNWEEALMQTVGQSKDERINKLMTTAIICVGLSSGFTLLTANSIEQNFQDMLDSGSLNPEDTKLVQDFLGVMDDYKKSPQGEQLRLWGDEDWDNMVSETPDHLSALDGGDDDGGDTPGGPAFNIGEGPGGLPTVKDDERDKKPLYVISGADADFGTSISKNEVLSMLSNPSVVEDIKSGKVNLSINNDQELSDLISRITSPMPASGGRQLTLFEDESVRSSAGNTSSVNPGNRLFNDPNPETSSITRNYINTNSPQLGIQHSDPQPVTEINEQNSKNIADAYESMENNPNDPKVKKAYTALANETTMQYQSLINAGYTIEVYKGKGEPYANSDEMIKDVRDNKHLYIFGTEAGFGQEQISDQMREENPLLQGTEFTDVNGEPLLVNDLFRAVHDFFGHTELGNGFGVKGEENAWLNHSRMFSHDARRAMTTETRGQNSWVNFNQSLRREDGSIPQKGDPDYVRPQDRPFADQKIGLLPDEFVFQQPAKAEVDTEAGAEIVQDTPFKYNRSTKLYEGTVNGRPFSLSKKYGKQEWVESTSGTLLGRTKKEAIKTLKVSMQGLPVMDLMASTDQITEDLAGVIDLINASTNPHESDLDPNIKSAENTETLVDRTIRGIDSELDRINRNKGKNLYMDITMGLGPVAWETFLKTLKASLKAGQAISVAFNNAVESIKGLDEVKDESIESLKKRFLFNNDGVVKFAEEAITNKVTGAKFFEALQERYPDQYNEIEAKEIYKIAKQRVNPKVVRGNYTKNELKQIDNLQRKIDQHNNVDMKNDPSLSDPMQILFDGGFVVLKNGKPVIKTLSFNFGAAPIFAGMSEQQKIELASNLLIQDFNVNSSKIDLEKATGWYSKTKDLIQQKFGGNAPIFFELLGVTSPQAPPQVIFRKSTEVLRSYSEGKFDESLEVYDAKVKDIMAQYDQGVFGTGKKALFKAKELIRQASSDQDVVAAIKKKNGKSFGLPVVTSGIVRVLYGNWLSNNPANKTGQFYNNLSLRDRSATIDVWAARNMRRILYSQGGFVPFRRRQSQETTVGNKDFAFAQSVYAIAAKKLNLNPDDLQASMWFIEKQIYNESGFTGDVRAKEQSTMENAVRSADITDRVMIGASTFIGNTSPEQKNRIYSAAARAVQKALERNATDEEIAAVIAETMQGSIRMDQALQNLDAIVKQLGAMGRPYQSEGIYMNQTEDTINLEMLVDAGTDISPLVDELLTTAINNEQESVFISKVTTEQDPNARPFRRIEFSEPMTLTEAREFANEHFGPNGVEGLTLNYNQQAEVVGMSMQFVPEYLMEPMGEGLTMENIDNLGSKWTEGVNKAIREIQEKYGDDIFNTVEFGYINTKVFTNGEYETTTRQEKSFDTDINRELARRQRAINSGDNAQDISDLRTGDEYSSRSVQRFQILTDFADKLDQIYKDLGGNAYADPFMSVPIIRAALKTASLTLRATSSVATAIDAAIDYLKKAQAEGDKFVPNQEAEIRELFRDFLSTQEGLFNPKQSNMAGETELTEEEASKLDELDEHLEKTREEQDQIEDSSNSEVDTKDWTLQDYAEALSNLQKDQDAAFSRGKDNFFGRLKNFRKTLDDKFVALKELTVDSKYRIKRSIRNIGKDLNLGETASNALASITLWLTVPGTAKEFIDQANKRIWGTLSSAQIKLVGQLSTLERIIEIDNLYDAQKSAADAIIKNLNSLSKKLGKAKKDQKSAIKEAIKQAESELDNIYKDNSNINIKKNEDGSGYYLEYLTKDKDGKDISERMKPGIKPVLDPTTKKKKFPWRLKHPETKNPKGEGYMMMNKELAQGMIDSMKEEQGDRFNIIRETTDKLFEEYRNELKRNFEAGLIDEATYNELKNLKYNPRKFVDHVIFAERDIISQRRSGRSEKGDHMQSPIKTLKQGSDQVLYMDPVKLLQNTLAIGAKLRAENEVRKGIYNMISAIASQGFEYINGLKLKGEDIGYILKDGEQVADGHIEMSYSENGKNIRFAMKNAAYKSLFANPRDGIPTSGWARKALSPLRRAGSILKVFATGVGAPAFFIANIFYDFAQQVIFTDTYNGKWYGSTLATKFAVAGKDWLSVMIDAATNGPLSQEYKMLGGSLEFMTRYGLMDYVEDTAIDEVQLEKRVREIMADPANKLPEFDARQQAAREQVNSLYGDEAPYVNPNTKSGWDIFKRFISAPNSTSEMTGRLANYKRWTKKYVQEYKDKNDGQEPTGEDLIAIKKRAVANAVDYANFNNGGTAIKAVDAMGFAYLNAASQVLDKSVRYVSENPAQFAWDTAQWALTFGAGLMAYNLQYFDILDEDEEERLQENLNQAIANGDTESEKEIRQKLYENRRYFINHINDYDLENYHCVILPGKVTDIISQEKETALQDQLRIAKSMEVGPERDARIAEIKEQLSDNKIITPRYFKIPSDARMNVFRAITEDMMFKHVTGSDFRNLGKDVFSYTPWGRGEDKNSYGRILQKAIPTGAGNPRDLMASNPLLNATAKVLWNYDAFYNKPVWSDKFEAENGYNQYRGLSDSYEDRILKDISKGFDKIGLAEGGIPVTTTKSALGSLFTNMDRNPWYAAINHMYVASQGGLSDTEKEKYGNQMNLFMNDFLGPATKRYVGDIDLLRNKKSKLQSEADHVRKTEERFQANLKLSYDAVMKEMNVRQDPDTNEWIDSEGKTMRLSDLDGDGYLDPAEMFLSRSNEIINKVEEELRGRLGEDEVIDDLMWNRGEIKKRINRMVIMNWNYSTASSDVQQAITDYKQGNPMTAAYMMWMLKNGKTGLNEQQQTDLRHTLEGRDSNGKRYEKEDPEYIENIMENPEVLYMMRMWSAADEEKLKRIRGNN